MLESQRHTRRSGSVAVVARAKSVPPVVLTLQEVGVWVVTPSPSETGPTPSVGSGVEAELVVEEVVTRLLTDGQGDVRIAVGIGKWVSKRSGSQ